MSAELTVGQLVAELLKLDQDAKIYRHDYEYGAEPVEGVEVEPAATYGGYPSGRTYEYPERIVIQ